MGGKWSLGLAEGSWRRRRAHSLARFRVCGEQETLGWHAETEARYSSLVVAADGSTGREDEAEAR
jgi:hypothetical protein